MKFDDCTNISIDLTNSRIVATFEDGSTFDLKTDLYAISAFDLLRGVNTRIQQHLNKNFDGYNSRAARVKQHAASLTLRNGQIKQKQGVSRTPH